MKISAALRFPFRGPHAWANIGCLAVCFLIPIVGPLVMLGYLVGVKRALIENMEADAPRFDFGKFAFYLTRGVWPFLVNLMFGFIIVPFVWLAMAACFAGGALINNHQLGIGIALIVVGALSILASSCFSAS